METENRKEPRFLGEFLEFTRLVFSAVKETAAENLSNLYSQIVNHRLFLYLWRRAWVSFVAATAVPLTMLMVWAFFRDGMAQGVIFFAGFWGLAFGALFFIFAAPLGVLIEAVVFGKLDSKKIGKQYVKHGANALLFIAGVALFFAVIPVKNTPEMFPFFLLAVAVSALGGNYWIARLTLTWVTRAVIVVSLFSFFFPQDFAFLREKNVDGHLRSASTEGVTVSGAKETRARARFAQTRLAYTCVDVSAKNAFYRLDREGCFKITIPPKGIMPRVDAYVGGWFYDVRNPSKPIKVVFSSNGNTFPIQPGRCLPDVGIREPVFRLKGRPGTTIEVLISPRQLAPCGLGT